MGLVIHHFVPKMKHFSSVVITVAMLLSQPLYAGDDASGPVRYVLELAGEHAEYEMSDADKRWSSSLVENLGYDGEAVHFVRTSMVVEVNERPVEDAVYHALEYPDYYYISEGDAMLKLGAHHPFSPGVGGFSMHAPKIQQFIVCLYCRFAGVPIYQSSPVTRGHVSWMGHDTRRLEPEQ